jgi:aspartyl/asparaginyl-tRNA synthetase
LGIVTARILIKDLAHTPEGPVTVSGWVETVRDQKKVQFVVLRDETGAAQLVHPVPEERDAVADVISGLAQGTFLTVTGELKLDERVKLGGLEVKVAGIEIAAAAIPETPIAADSGIDKRMDWRFLDLRTARNNLLFRAQTTFEHAMRTFWIERGYIEIHTPKLMASASESNAELFELEYFETKAYLA